MVYNISINQLSIGVIITIITNPVSIPDNQDSLKKLLRSFSVIVSLILRSRYSEKTINS